MMEGRMIESKGRKVERSEGRKVKTMRDEDPSECNVVVDQARDSDFFLFFFDCNDETMEEQLEKEGW
jgi:hypothetical protein